MARARNIKPGFYKNEDLAECSIWARFIFPGLWMLADREGRLEDRPKRIKAELLPFDSQDVEPLLRELAEKRDRAGVPFIIRYQNEDGRFIQISKFSAHQSPHYSEKASVIKPPALPEKGGDISDGNSGSGGCMNSASSQENSGSDQPIKRGSQPPDSLIPDSPILRFSDSPTADCLKPEKVNPVCAAASPSTRPKRQKDPAKGAAAWEAYATAYFDVWSAEPVRNARANALMAQLVDRIGAEEAPHVAAFYVRSRKSAYTSRRHPVQMLVADAEGLRTEWATNRASTTTAAMQEDRTAAQGDVWKQLKQEVRDGRL